MFAKVSQYNQQNVVLEIDFSGLFFGYTELTIVPTSKDLKTIYLHSRQCTITSIQVGGYNVQDWIYHDPLSNVVMSDITDCHRHPEVKRKMYSSLAECDEGELAIPIPRQVPIRSSGQVAGMLNGDTGMLGPQSPAHAIPLTQQASSEFAPIQVRISYCLKNPVEGIQFILPSDAYPYRVPHMYTTSSSPDAARCWIPCLDSLWERCIWDFKFIVPKTLEGTTDDMDVDNDDLNVTPTVVLAHPNNANKVIYHFKQDVPTSVQHVAFAAGPFCHHQIQLGQEQRSGHAEETVNSQIRVDTFCLPGYESSLSNMASFVRSSLNSYITDCGSYPFGSYTLLFVDELLSQRVDSASLTIVSSDLLHGDDAIDQVYESRQVLLHGLACQWVGISIIPKTWSDLWLVNGLGLYIAGLCFKKHMGNNEYRFRLKKDVERVLELDNGTMPPICQPGSMEPPDASTLAFINLKAPLVLHILDRRLGKSGTSLGLSRVLPKIFLSATAGDMAQNCLSTHFFLRTCRKVSGVDLRSFVDQWIHGSGCPQFSFLATFNRKKMAVEIQMRQECPAYAIHQNDPISNSLLKPVPFFEGQMTVRIHEADGTPYEHVLDILSPIKRFEVPFNTKYKRVRRNTKRYLARQAAAQAAAEGDTEAAEAMGMVDMSFGLEIWENEEEREKWKVTDWTEEEEQAMAGATYEWIRMDADFEWIARIQFEQPDYMWVSQLQRDRDVVAQVEAVHALARQPTPIVSSTLTKTVLVTNYFFRVRCEAALALVNCASRRLDFVGLFHLFKLFLRYCYEPEDSSQDLFSHKFVPRPNDFSDVAEYFALVNAISQVRFENGKTPPEIRQFFIDQLRYNDNTTNAYSDAYYIASLITALACATISTAPPERGELTMSVPKNDITGEDHQLLQAAITEVDRYRSMDRLIPSVHNVVTIASLEFHIMLAMANLIPSDPKIFLLCTREGNATQVRLAGFDGLFLTKWYTPKIMTYIFAVIANDSSRAVRRQVARNMCESLALLASIGEIKAPAKETESLLIEEDGTAPDKAKESKKSEVDLMIRALRKDREVGKSDILRTCVMPVILDPQADLDVRLCMLKLADLVVRGADEPLPKNTIHLPPTPVTESPPVVPMQTPSSIKIAPKVSKPQIKIGQRKQSLATPSTPTPSTSHAPSKLRLAPSGSTMPPASVDTENIAPAAESRFKEPLPPLLPSKAAPGSKKKDKPIPKSQSGGMSIQDVKACQAALKRLNTCKAAFLFLQPVDPIRDKAPDYFDVIKNPMDLQTMGHKLQNGMYKNRQDLESDFRLMIRNCRTYNPQGSYAYNESVALETFFDKVWTKINATVTSAEKAAPKFEAAAKPSIPPAPAPVEDTNVIAPEPTSSAPKLKLKLGPSQPAANTEASKAGPLKAKHPPKPRKPKTVEKATDMPPPPYIDDGSHDLLQEVIAMEELEKSPTKSSSLKSRKVVELDADEELLRLASPEPKVVPEHSSVVEKHHSPAAHSTHLPISSPKPAPTPVKPKKLTERPVQPSKSVKGKEKEADMVPPAPSSQASSVAPYRPKKSRSATPMATTSTTVPINEAKCRDLLRILVGLPQSFFFREPVDPIRDGCPTYYDEIKNPMDFATISGRLKKGHYSTMEEFGSDIELIFANCRQFNPPGTLPVINAESVEKVFRREWPKAVEKRLSFKEKRGLMSAMTKLMNDVAWFAFWEPVDPVALQIPDYHDVIPKRDARDLRTIRSKLETDKYDSIEAWEADMNLMVDNAIKFNGLESEVGQTAVRMRDKIREESARVRTQKKRPATGDLRENSDQGNAKKAKLS
ncbi:uncharacterized protein FOMMEDRAFT_161628 [Fomitiporia mediterranea MF3/22]|uniref:uncharacterized protein n=1 Tax=Fomitiporia mediterranea (strain MF3/22) TaxID=694068 RepID=UPI0004407544|nr:uncharacterized protein FOMMEDRAFT_161628 [Fomitiporia mediterranea MF3/22]EJC98793.1 hypothetical protein FOMMEDRAFT_161628 [Fomitiporia mediterranea MF3/22]